MENISKKNVVRNYCIPNYKDFDWKSYKFNIELYLNKSKLFRKANNKDIWAFLIKYQTFQLDLSYKKAREDLNNINRSKLESLLSNSKRLSEIYQILHKCEKVFLFAFPLKYTTELQFIILCYLNFCIKNYMDKYNKMKANKENLPINKFKEELIETIQQRQIIVIAGDTGCGKSTQVPQYLLEMGFKNIACTQPRRIACISLCKRVTQEIKTSKNLDDYLSDFFGNGILMQGNNQNLDTNSSSNLTKDIVVGYQIRFDKTYFGGHPKKTGDDVARQKLTFLTEGLLLRQLGTDPNLSRYDCIVIDEVHERHSTTDFLLGAIKCIMGNATTSGTQDGSRSQFKLVLMSATINTELFVSYFANSGFVQVPGRLYPIETVYMPLKESEKSDSNQKSSASSKIICTAPYTRLLQIIDTKYPSPDRERGDVLIFLPGMAEIKKVKEALEEYSSQSIHEKRRMGLGEPESSASDPRSYQQKGCGHWIILALHGSLSTREQDRVFDWTPPGFRKCVLATNVAETSVTIDGIRFVVDSGKVKELHYDPVRKISRLKTFWVSKAAAEQRKGRAGRTGPGVCFRLYDKEHEFEGLSPYGTSEISKIPIHTLVLQMLSLDITSDIKSFPFIEPPSETALDASLNYLRDQKALNLLPGNILRITPFGRVLAQLPLDITVAKMLLCSQLLVRPDRKELSEEDHDPSGIEVGGDRRLVDLTLTFAALLSIQSPLTSKARNDTRAFLAREEFESIGHGDPFTLFNLFNHWLKLKLGPINRPGRDSESTDSRSRRWCRRLGLEEQRFYEVLKLREQFAHITTDFVREFRKGPQTTPTASPGGLTGLSDQAVDDYDESSREKRRFITRLKRERLDKDGRIKILRISRDSDADDDQSVDGESGEDSSSDVDIEDMELKLMKNNDIQKLYVEDFTIRDAMLLKFIMTSGLYPQIALPDQFNTFKRGSDLVYHTKEKAFVVIHPHSSLNSDPETYLTHDRSSVTLLGYVSLLETTKPYLVNAYTLPALTTLLLFSRLTLVDKYLTKMVFEDWVELKFTPDLRFANAPATTAQNSPVGGGMGGSGECHLVGKIGFVARVLAFRGAWEARTSPFYQTRRADDTFDEGGTGPEANAESADDPFENLSLEVALLSFLTTEHTNGLSYSIKKIGNSKGNPRDPLAQTIVPDMGRGNYGRAGSLDPRADDSMLNFKDRYPYFAYDRLPHDTGTICTDAIPNSVVECPICAHQMPLLNPGLNGSNDILRVLAHFVECYVESFARTKPTPESRTLVFEKGRPATDKNRSSDDVGNGYRCEICDKIFGKFSKIDILRHRKSHE